VTHGDFLTLGIANVSDVEGMASTPRTELEAVGSTYLARRRAAVDAALTASGCVAPFSRYTPRNYGGYTSEPPKRNTLYSTTPNKRRSTRGHPSSSIWPITSRLFFEAVQMGSYQWAFKL
jgi:hypothetical protein